MADLKRPTPRVQEHLDRLREAGLDAESFFEALIAIRDDSGLPTAHREALYRAIGMESFVWYLEALQGEPIDRLEMIAEAMQAVEASAAPAPEKKAPPRPQPRARAKPRKKKQ